MSSFKRKTKTVDDSSSSSSETSAAVVDRFSGIKAWVNTGLGIVSSGNRSLDDILGGGIPFGSTILQLTELYSNYGLSLLAYQCAESLSHGHYTAVIGSEEAIDNFRNILPSNRNIDPEPESIDSSSTSSGLSIAWQYEKYLNKMKDQTNKSQSVGSLPFCCSYDCSKRIQASLDSNLANIIVPREKLMNEQLLEVLEWILASMRLFIGSVRKENIRAPVRVFLPDFHEIIARASSPQLVARFLLRLKRMTWDTRTIVAFGMNPKMVGEVVIQTFEQAMDTVLAVESFASRMHAVPYEFDRFHAFLVIHKLQQVGMLAPIKPSASRFGIIRDRRKLNVEPLHLPPEESRAFPSSNSSGGCSSASLTSTKSSSAASHEHGHNHSHGHDHQASTPSTTSSATQVVASAASSVTPASAPKSSLAASLAVARAARQQAQEASTGGAMEKSSSLASSLAAARVARQTGSAASGGTAPSKVQPISITSARPPAPPSIDF